jgi:hypothetical protein
VKKKHGKKERKFKKKVEMPKDSLKKTSKTT